jgi:8-oxo-dGTP diphosphatase
MPTNPDSPFYRVSVKAVIFDADRKLLVFQDKDGEYEMPGGGWEHGETLEECITRELYEEMRVAPAEIGPVSFVYTAQHDKGYQKLCVIVPVTLKSHEFVPTEDDLVSARFITREEFMKLPFQSNEAAVRNQVDQIWS